MKNASKFKICLCGTTDTFRAQRLVRFDPRLHVNHPEHELYKSSGIGSNTTKYFTFGCPVHRLCCLCDYEDDGKELQHLYVRIGSDDCEKISDILVVEINVKAFFVFLDAPYSKEDDRVKIYESDNERNEEEENAGHENEEHENEEENEEDENEEAQREVDDDKQAIKKESFLRLLD